MTKPQVALVAAAVVAVIASVPLLMLQREITRLRAAPAPTSRTKAASPHLPAPKFTFSASTALVNAPRPTTNPLLAKLLHGDAVPKLTPAQVEAYLAQNQRNAASLLAAYGATGDQTLLREAMQNFPHDPKVDLAAYFADGLSPADRRTWLDNLKQADPTNALGDVLSAYNDFQSGQSDLALQELSAASGKPGWNDYGGDLVESTEEAYLAAGYSPSEAKVIAVAGESLPQLVQMRDLGRNLVDLAAAYQNNGDASSAQASLQLALSVGRQMTQNQAQPIVTIGTGLLIERQALSTMDPATPIDDQGHTVQDQLQYISSQLQGINTIGGQEDALFSQLTEADLATYFERQKMFGEAAALQWAQGKYGVPTAPTPVIK